MRKLSKKILWLPVFLLLFVSPALIAQDETETTKPETQDETTPQTQEQTPQSQDQMQGMDQDDQFAEDLTNDLATRINLNDEQKVSVKEALTEYQSSITEGKDQTEAEASVNSAIEEVLTEEQKTSWQSVSTDWWNQVHTMSPTTRDSESEPQQQDQTY